MGLALVMSLMSLAPAAHAQQPAQSGSSRGPFMAILGSGSHEVPPATASLDVRIETTGATLAEAVEPHAAKAQAVREAIERLGADGLQLRRASYSSRLESPMVPNAQGVVVRAEPIYRAVTRFTLGTSQLDKLQSQLTQLAGLPDLLFDGVLRFSAADERRALLQARQAAARDAREQALAYAEATGVRLVEIMEITDGEARPADGVADMPSLSPGALVFVVPQSLTFHSSVNIVWRIRAGGR
ncbi:MAG: SIMPL domain-containing protein [Phreatobacter sp.]